MTKHHLTAKEIGVAFRPFYKGDSSSDWLERRPVTPEVAGSSPVYPAKFGSRSRLFRLSTVQAAGSPFG